MIGTSDKAIPYNIGNKIIFNDRKYLRGGENLNKFIYLIKT